MSAHESISQNVSKRDIIQRAVFLVVVALMAVFLVYAPPLLEARDSNVSAKFNDGEYTGTGEGFHGTMQLKVTVSNGLIAAIEMLNAADDYQFYNHALEVMTPAIIAGQTLQVDTVSGATYSSEGIIEAVANALTAAH